MLLGTVEVVGGCKFEGSGGSEIVLPHEEPRGKKFHHYNTATYALFLTNRTSHLMWNVQEGCHCCCNSVVTFGCQRKILWHHGDRLLVVEREGGNVVWKFNVGIIDLGVDELYCGYVQLLVLGDAHTIAIEKKKKRKQKTIPC